MANDIHIKIGSSFSGEGFRQLDSALKASSNGVKRAIAPVDAAIRTFSDLGGEAGKAFGIAGKFLTGFATMGVWGVLIASITAVVGWFTKWRAGAEDAALATKGLSREFMTLEAAAAGYNRRMDRMRKAAEELKRAEKERADQAKKILASDEVWLGDDQKKQMLAGNKNADRYRAAQSDARQAALEGELIGEENPYKKVELVIRKMAEAANEAVRKARYSLDDAKIGGNASEIRLAEIMLATALQRRKNALEEARLLARQAKEEHERQEAAARKENQLAQMAEERERLRTIIAEREKSHADRMAELDRRIEDARSRAAQLEENASGARGISVDDWLRNRRNEERQRRREERRQAARMKNAQEELERLTNPRTRRVRSDWEKKRIADLQEWIADQDPSNNPALQEAERLQAEQARLEAEQLSVLKELNDRLKNLTEE